MAFSDSVHAQDAQVVKNGLTTEEEVDLEKGLQDGGDEDSSSGDHESVGQSRDQPRDGDSDRGSDRGNDSGNDEPMRDPNLVQWDGPDDSDNPKNWAKSRKTMTIICVSCFTLISPIASSIVAPGLPVISQELHVTKSTKQALILSIFVAAYALGPLLWGPLSELYGRAKVIKVSNVWFICFNLGCALAKTKGQMLAFRFLAGIGGSAPLAVGAGVVGDLFTPEERGSAGSIYNMAPILGPALGPLAGGFIVQGTTWRWAFWATSIAAGVVQAAGLFLLQETYAPVLLGRKKQRLIKETGNDALHTQFEKVGKTSRQVVFIALWRPFRMLATQRIVQILSLYMMFLYGVIYLVLYTFASLWTKDYHESSSMAGINYISMGLGFGIGALICGPAQDRIYAFLKRRLVPDGGPGRPEFRVPMLIPSAILLPMGLLIYSWAAEKHWHPIVPDIGAFFFSMALIIGMQSLSTYALDAYPTYAASVISVMTILRSLAGFVFPLFAPAMYEKLGYGKGGVVLAGVAILIGSLFPILLWYYGRRLRPSGASNP